jgi:hypothetical protein
MSARPWTPMCRLLSWRNTSSGCGVKCLFWWFPEITTWTRAIALASASPDGSRKCAARVCSSMAMTSYLPKATVTLCPWWDGPVSRAGLESQLHRFAKHAGHKWIWVHHAPPDYSAISWNGKKFVGDKYLVDWIRHFEPDLVFCGHVHNAPFYPEGSWIDRIGKTWVFNPGRQIGPRPTSIVFDLDAMTAEWCSLEEQSLRQLAIQAVEIRAPAVSADGA